MDKRLKDLLAAKARAERADTEKQWAWTDARGYLEERDLLLAVLAQIYPSHRTTNSRTGKVVLCIHTPAGKMAWTIHSASQSLREAVEHLPIIANDWDGADARERTERLRRLSRSPLLSGQEWRHPIADAYRIFLLNARRSMMAGKA